MELNFIKNDNHIVVYLQGRFDVYHSEKIEKEISKLIERETSSHLIFNLKNVEYLSSSGIGLLVSVMIKLKKRGKKLVICDLANPVKKILDVVEMTSLFNISKTEDEAREFLTGQ